MYLSKSRIIMASLALLVIVIGVLLLLGSKTTNYSEVCHFPDFNELKAIDYKVKSEADIRSFRCVQAGYL